ncbi:MAG TPA: hypothetical protein VFC46_08555 [Humisphaera sp.]|nr:hypothetical protein [Humisphaera sp.]
MPPEVRKLLNDMADAVDSIVSFTRDRELDDLTTDDLFRSAIYWNK